jgi:hypothetical protein
MSGCTTGSPARVGGGAACRAGPADRREEGGRQGGPRGDSSEEPALEGDSTRVWWEVTFKNAIK